MTDFYAIFAYSDADTEELRNQLFDSCGDESELTILVPGRMLAGDPDDDIPLSIITPELADEVTITPEVPCVIARGDRSRLQGESEHDSRQKQTIIIQSLERIYKSLDDRPDAGYVIDCSHAGSILDKDAPHPVTKESLATNRFNDAAWVMFFTPEMVDQYGQETLLNLPAQRIDELDDGTVVIVAQGDPSEYTEFPKIADSLGLSATRE